MALMILLCLLGATRMASAAPVLQDYFSTATLDSSRWTTIEVPGGGYELVNGNLRFNAITTQNDWNRWSLRTNQAFARNDASGRLLRVTFDIRQSAGAMYIAGWVPATGTFSASAIKYALHDTGSALLPMNWSSFGSAWTPEIPGVGGVDIWYSLRITLLLGQGARYEYRRGMGTWRTLRETVTGDATQFFQFALLNCLPLNAPPGNVDLDNLTIEYVEPDGSPAISGPILEFEDNFDLPSGTRFDPGLYWYNGAWPSSSNPPAVHDGLGHLLLTPGGSWNNPGLTTAGGAFYPIRDDAGIDYQLDFELTVAGNKGDYYLGAASYVSASDWRGFFLRSTGELAVSTDRVGSGLGSGGNARGVSTGLTYPVGIPFKLRMNLLASGAVAWYADLGTGFQLLVPQSTPQNPASSADLTKVNTWPTGKAGGEIGAEFADNVSRRVSHYLNIEAKGAVVPPVSMLKLDRLAVTTSAYSQALCRNGLRSGTRFRTARYQAPPVPFGLPSGFAQASVAFQDPFNGAAGTGPESALWNYQSNGGTFLHDGQGHLVGTSRGADPQWNSPTIQSKFNFPQLGTSDYFLEFRLVVPQYQHHFLGFSCSDGSRYGLRRSRSFLLLGPYPTNNGSSAGAIALHLNQDPGFQCGWGLETDRSYTPNQAFGLMMWIRANRGLAYYCDFGQGWEPLTALGRNASWDHIPLALIWDQLPGDQFHIKVDCNGWLASSAPNMILDTVKVYQSAPLPDTPPQSTPTPTPTPLPGGKLNRLLHWNLYN